MSKICQITGKKAMIGNNVSHSKKRTKRTFDVNLFNKKFYYVEQDCWISLSLSAAGLRLINKKGLDGVCIIDVSFTAQRYRFSDNHDVRRLKHCDYLTKRLRLL
jgi:large subunit ribosomal protein L28